MDWYLDHRNCNNILIILLGFLVREGVVLVGMEWEDSNLEEFLKLGLIMGVMDQFYRILGAIYTLVIGCELSFEDLVISSFFLAVIGFRGCEYSWYFAMHEWLKIVFRSDSYHFYMILK